MGKYADWNMYTDSI